MTAYRTIIVGTDGSESSYKAVEKAATLAADADARLVLACAYYPHDDRDTASAADVLKEDAYQIRGTAPTDDILRTAREKAKAKGAKDLLSASSKLKPWGKKSLGDNVEFWMFEKDGKAGFYGVKTFEGKDKTTYCCAPGEQADAEAMKPVVDKAKAEMLAGVCLSLVQKQ